MGEFTTLMARDGHEFNAWLAAPQGGARGFLVGMEPRELVRVLSPVLVEVAIA